jgi:hypothetical protein
VGYLTQHKLHRSKICVSKIKNLSKNLNCFAAKRQKFSGFPKSPTHRTKNAPKSTFCVCHNKNSKRRTRFEKLHRRAFTRKRKKKRSREDKKPRAGDNTKAICTFPPTPRARVLFCPFGFFGFLSVARGVWPFKVPFRIIQNNRMSALTHALDSASMNNHHRAKRDVSGSARNSRESTSTSSPDISPDVTNAHGGMSAIAMLRANVWEEAQRRGENFAGEDAKTRALLETKNAEQMFVGRKSVEIEQVASFGNIQIAPAVSAFQSTDAFGGSSSLPREVPRVRRVTVYDDDMDEESDVSSPGRKRRGASTSYLAIEADMLSRSDENVGMLCSSPNRKNFTSAPFAAIFGGKNTAMRVGSPLGHPSSPQTTSRGFQSAPFAAVYGSPNAPSSPASRSSLNF